jgi:hypothetical protein
MRRREYNSPNRRLSRRKVPSSAAASGCRPGPTTARCYGFESGPAETRSRPPLVGRGARRPPRRQLAGSFEKGRPIGRSAAIEKKDLKSGPA